MSREELEKRILEARYNLVSSKDKETIDILEELAVKALEQEPYEKFESTKDHIYKLAGDYKCWDNRLTEDEAVELCHILEQEPILDKIRAEIKEEKEYAYADFEQYKVDYLGQDEEDVLDSLPQDDFRYGMERAIEIIDKYRKEN